MGNYHVWEFDTDTFPPLSLLEIPHWWDFVMVGICRQAMISNIGDYSVAVVVVGVGVGDGDIGDDRAPRI